MPRPFSEKSFYLDEFRGRTLGFCARASGPVAGIDAVAADLRANATRVVLLSDAPDQLGVTLETACVDAAPPALPALPGAAWRSLRRAPVLGMRVAEGEGFERACGDVALRLGLKKLVWIDPDGGLVSPDGRTLSLVHLEELQGLLRDARVLPEPRAALLEEIERLVLGGVPAVNVCTAAGLAEELFTYAGSGTLVTRERYVQVRPLGLDDYDAADDLIRRGVEEGYLAPRDDAGVDAVLAGAFGAFVEGTHLAGIAGMLPLAGSRFGELVSVYTLTRFLGEGVGAYLVGYAAEQAAAQGLEGLVACTTSEGAGAFFLRHGFEVVDADTLPAEKWRDYDPERRARVRCYLRRSD